MSRPTAGDAALVLGTFPAERFWASPDHARLPAVAPLHPSRVLEGMDQLLAAVCRPGDTLLTRRAFHPALAEYLYRAGPLGCGHAALEAWDAGAPPVGDAAPVAETWLRRQAAGTAPALPATLRRLCPYAVEPGTAALCDSLGLPPQPEHAVAVRVNAKTFSTRLADELGVGYGGTAVATAGEFHAAAGRLLASGPLVAKLDHGVSGEGSAVISDGGRLARIHRHLAAEEDAGRTVSLVVEPLLERAGDFSCQLEITPGGACRILGLQATINRGFSYAGSAPFDDRERDALLGSGYGGVMEEVGRRLGAAGYHGFACVDSMRLASGVVVPLVEINARMSMGLVNLSLSERLSSPGGGTFLSYLPVSAAAPVDVPRLLGALEAEGALFGPGTPRGLVPLASATLPLDHGPADADGVFRGRFYFAAPSARPLQESVARARSALEAAGVQTPGLR